MLSALGVRVVSPRDLGISEDPVEDGATFEDNALIKARFYSQRTGLPCLADDSGLVVDALGGRPGVLSSRFAPTDAERIARLLKELGGVPDEKRTAHFVCAAALVVPATPPPGAREILEKGICEGVIALKPRGTNGFGYDPVFLIPLLGKTMAELAPEAKNALSHPQTIRRAQVRPMPVFDSAMADVRLSAPVEEFGGMRENGAERRLPIEPAGVLAVKHQRLFVLAMAMVDKQIIVVPMPVHKGRLQRAPRRGDIRKKGRLLPFPMNEIPAGGQRDRAPALMSRCSIKQVLAVLQPQDAWVSGPSPQVQNRLGFDLPPHV